MYPRDQYWVQSCSTSSFLIWIMGQSVPSGSFHDTKSGGVADTPEACAAIQRDFNRPDKRSDRNLMRFNKEKCKVLHLGRNNLMHQYMLGSNQLESSLAGKDLGVLVVLLLAETELIFFIGASMELCFGFVLKTVLIIQACFCYCSAVLTQSQGLFCFSHQRVGWGCTRSWEGTQLGQLTPTDQRDIPYHMTSCSAYKAGGRRHTHTHTFRVMVFVFPGNHDA